MSRGEFSSLIQKPHAWISHGRVSATGRRCPQVHSSTKPIPLSTNSTKRFWIFTCPDPCVPDVSTSTTDVTNGAHVILSSIGNAVHTSNICTKCQLLARTIQLSTDPELHIRCFLSCQLPWLKMLLGLLPPTHYTPVSSAGRLAARCPQPPAALVGASCVKFESICTVQPGSVGAIPRHVQASGASRA